MQKTYGIVALALLVCSTMVFAGSGKFYVQGGAGISFAKIGKTQRVDVNGAPVTTNTYTDKTPNSSLFTKELHVGYTLPTYKKMSLSVGLGVYDSANQTVKGRIYQLNDPRFYNYDYRYKVHMSHLILESTLSYAVTQHILPYVMVGVGCAKLGFRGYKPIPKNSDDIMPPLFANKTVYHTAGQIGVGVQFVFNQHWSSVLGYQYAYLGEAESGRYGLPNAAGRLKTGGIYLHEIILGVHYTF